MLGWSKFVSKETKKNYLNLSTDWGWKDIYYLYLCLFHTINRITATTMSRTRSVLRAAHIPVLYPSPLLLSCSEVLLAVFPEIILLFIVGILPFTLLCCYEIKTTRGGSRILTTGEEGNPKGVANLLFGHAIFVKNSTKIKKFVPKEEVNVPCDPHLIPPQNLSYIILKFQIDIFVKYLNEALYPALRWCLIPHYLIPIRLHHGMVLVCDLALQNHMLRGIPNKKVLHTRVHESCFIFTFPLHGSIVHIISQWNTSNDADINIIEMPQNPLSQTW